MLFLFERLELAVRQYSALLTLKIFANYGTFWNNLFFNLKKIRSFLLCSQHTVVLKLRTMIWYRCAGIRRFFITLRYLSGVREHKKGAAAGRCSSLPRLCCPRHDYDQVNLLDRDFCKPAFSSVLCIRIRWIHNYLASWIRILTIYQSFSYRYFWRKVQYCILFYDILPIFNTIFFRWSQKSR